MGARGSFKGLFSPALIGKIARWYRLAASVAVSGEYETIVEVFGGTAITQPGALRKPSAAASTNGLPVATFDGSDMWLMTLDTPGTGNNADAAWEIDFWLKASNVAATQRAFAVDTTTGANLNRLRIGINSAGGMGILVFITNAAGRQFDTATNALTADTWTHVRFAYDSAGSTEASAVPAATDKVRLWLNGVATALTASDVGVGGVIGALRSATGTALFGAANDADAPVAALQNNSQLGPNITIATSVLTDEEAANLRNFEAPT